MRRYACLWEIYGADCNERQGFRLRAGILWNLVVVVFVFLEDYLENMNSGQFLTLQLQITLHKKKRVVINR